MFTDLSAIGLVALVMVLGYYLIVKLQSLLTKHLERQELLLQKILVEMMACREELSEIKAAVQIVDDSS